MYRFGAGTSSDGVNPLRRLFRDLKAGFQQRFALFPTVGVCRQWGGGALLYAESGKGQRCREKGACARHFQRSGPFLLAFDVAAQRVIVRIEGLTASS